MVYVSLSQPEKCLMCQKIERKKRRYEKLKQDYTRFRQDPSRKASMAKTLEDLQAIVAEIQGLVYERDIKRNQICISQPREAVEKHAGAVGAKPTVVVQSPFAVDWENGFLEEEPVVSASKHISGSHSGAASAGGDVEQAEKVDGVDDYVVVEKEGSCENGAAEARKPVLSLRLL